MSLPALRYALVRKCLDLSILLALLLNAIYCFRELLGRENSCRLLLRGNYFLQILSICVGLFHTIKQTYTSWIEGAKASAVMPQLDFNLSRSGNALRFLEFIVKAEVCIDIKKCATYCMDILKSSAEELHIPIGLLNQSAKPNGQDPQQIEDSVQDWLLSQFSRTSVCGTERRKSTLSISSGVPAPDPDEADHGPSLRAQPVAVPGTFGAGVLFECPVPAREADPEGTDLALPFQSAPEERQSILDALRGVDRWDWDVFALHRASQGRELEVRRRGRRDPKPGSDSARVLHRACVLLAS